MKVYIKSSECISVQPTFESGLPTKIEEVENSGFYTCLKPEYKKYIKPKLLRRMSPIIRNGVTCSMSVLEKAQVDNPGGIFVGTAWGCLKDTTSFLTQLIEENENLPNPTFFIQSTHNTIAGQLALMLSCHEPNFTFSQNHLSFETALLDAQLMLLDSKSDNILVGGVDEMTETTFDLVKDVKCYKNATMGEGAAFFLLSNEPSAVELLGIDIQTKNNFNLLESLKRIGVDIAEIDVVIGGDVHESDANYAELKQMFVDKPYVWYKPFLGEFGTVSAQSLWLATKIVEEAIVPECWNLNGIKSDKIKTVLVYNTKGDEHSLMVVRKGD